jgi:hypothetical protein
MAQSQYFSEDYKYQTFLLWYNNGRPSGRKLRKMIPANWGDSIPMEDTLRVWIKSEKFQSQAEDLDKQVSIELESRLVKEKVEMLSRHSDLGQKMQDMAIDYLESEDVSLSSNSAVRLLIEGIRVERESKGIPQALEKMINRTDEELIEEIKELTKGAQVEVLEDV